MKTYEKIYLILLGQDEAVSGEEIARELGISRTAVWKAIQQLEKKGLSIDSSRSNGYELRTGDLYIQDQLETELGFPVHISEKSQSTQLDARAGMEMSHTAPGLYLAPKQTAAKGRFGRSFYTNTGGIYMSLHLAPNAAFGHVRPYTILIAAALMKAIEDLTGIATQVKWVNDIYLGNRKIAGILTEGISDIESQTVTDLIIGVGINFHVTDFPQEIAERATSLFTEKPSITRSQLIVRMWRTFFEMADEDLFALYKEKSLVLGKQVTFVEAGVPYSGSAIDLRPSGQLVVQLNDGTEKILSSGEISLSSW